MTTPGDCLRCGVCCFSQLETYVRLSGDDWAHFGAGVETVAHFIGHRAYMKMRDGHCAALAVQTAPDGGTEYFCTVYENRPHICRDLARGSPQCEAERVLKGARTAIAPA